MRGAHPRGAEYPRQGQHAGPATTYSSIDGAHLKTYVEDLAATSRRYRDNGHPQFWGRIIGTEADADNARWLLTKFKSIGLSDVREQPFDLPPQWMPQSWSVSTTAGGAATTLSSAQPTYRGVGTPAGGLDLEAVDVGFATDADLAAQDLKGKAVFFYSTDFQSRHSTISNGAMSASDRRFIPRVNKKTSQKTTDARAMISMTTASPSCRN